MVSGGGGLEPVVAWDVDLDFWRNEDPMEFPGLIKKIVDTTQFQRLRTIKQLGGSFNVYSAADHIELLYGLHIIQQAAEAAAEGAEAAPPQLDICISTPAISTIYHP